MKFINYIALFIVPIVLTIAGIYASTKELTGFQDLVVVIYIALAVISAIVIGAFLLINKFILKWKLNWWKNILLSILLSALAYAIFIVLTQL